MSENQINNFIEYRDVLTGKASLYAANILCFWADRCREEVISDPFAPVSSRTSMPSDWESNTQKLNDLKISPNPNAGIFEIVLESSEIDNVEILDIHGKKVEFILSLITLNSARVSLENNQQGLYILQVKHKSGKISTSRIVKN